MKYNQSTSINQLTIYKKNDYILTNETLRQRLTYMNYML